jgi:tetratricopeptide (TPR) repeat protein
MVAPYTEAMLRWFFVSVCVAQLQIMGFAAPAVADSAPPPDRQWPGGLPDDWRILGGEEAPPGDHAPGRFDFGRDRRARPLGQEPDLFQKPSPDGSAKSSDPANDAASAKAARAKQRSEELKKALAPRPEPAALRQRTLDELFKHLRAAADPEEAKGFAEAIRHVWMQAQSDTANLIMHRAMLASQSKNYPAALTLLDRLVALEPDWAEAWNQRATVRFLNDDTDGSMADIDRVIKLEPRHFAALTGMGVMLQRAGLDKRALEVFSKALEIYPAQPDLKQTVEKLGLDVNGRDI